jgi:hypothetical protein
MPDAVDQICADLEIQVIPTHQAIGPMKTKAGQTLRNVCRRHGAGHLIMVLRTITESAGNELALTEPCLLGISDVMLTHPTWPEAGLKWIEAFDGIDLLGMMKAAKANKRAAPARAAIATMLYAKLAPIFTPPPKPKRIKKPYVYKRGPRRLAMAEAA